MPSDTSVDLSDPSWRARFREFRVRQLYTTFIGYALFYCVRKNIPIAQAYDHVFGYTCVNDVSARDLQANHSQFFKGKSLDGACPIGPWIVTADEIPNPQHLQVTCRVNGVVKQNANTEVMIFHVPDLIAILSRGMTLDAGDILATGTPSGVGFARKPPEFLKPGDVVEVEIEKIGVLRNRVGE